MKKEAKALNKRKSIAVNAADFFLKIIFKPFVRFKKERPVKKILIIDFGFMGDTIISFPAVKSIRKKFPDAKITVLINPKFRDLWKYNKDYDELLEYDVPWGRYGFRLWPKDIIGYFKVIRKIRKEKFDLAVDFRGDLRNIFFFLYMSGSPLRAGFGITGGEYFLAVKAEFPCANEVENNLAVAKALGGKNENYSMNVGEEEMRKAEVFAKGKKIVLVFPTPGYKTKEWDNEKWARLCDALCGKFTVILSGAGNDSNIAKIVELSKTKPESVTNLNFNELAALMKVSHLVIGCDSGPMHMASAVGVNSVVLMGPTDITRWRPYRNSAVVSKNAECSPCGLYDECTQKEKQKCMKGISVEDVLREVR